MLIILDRDGVINEDLPTGVYKPEQFVLIDGSLAAIAALTQAGHTVVVATNQSVVAKGLISEAELNALHAELLRQVEAAGGKIAQIYVASEHPDAVPTRRKPLPTMLLEAMQDAKTTPAHTIMIGDALRDLQAAAAAGVRPILVATGKGAATHAALPDEMKPIAYVKNLHEAAQLILANAIKPR